MKVFSKVFFAGVVSALFCGGCSIFSPLPSGTPPEGPIVENPAPRKLTRSEIELALGSRLAASAMQYFPGSPVAVEADAASMPFAKAAVAEAGRICGVRLELVAAAVLNGKKKGDKLEFELFHFSASLWKCSFELKN